MLLSFKSKVETGVIEQSFRNDVTKNDFLPNHVHYQFIRLKITNLEPFQTFKFS